MMHLVLFDMDHTLIPADTGYLWVKYLNQHKLLNDEMVRQREQFFIDYQNGTLRVEDAYRFDIGILSYLDNKRSELLKDFFSDILQPLITQKAIDQVEEHKQQGDMLAIITATLEEIARPVAEYFGIDQLIGGKAEIDPAGKLTGEMLLGPCMGRGKLVHLEQWLSINNYSPSLYTFYSDSHNDLPLLEQVDIPIAVDPDDKLRAIALENEWRIISFIK